MRRFQTIPLMLAVAGLTLLTVPQVGSAAGEDPVLVGEDVAGDAALDPTMEPLGVDATHLYIHRPDFDKKEIVFIMKVTQLNAAPPPEIVRYMWDFKIGAREFRLQGKTTDIVTTVFVDDPAGALTHISGAFRLRGDCQIVGTVSSCRHLRWVEGEFDLENDQVEMRVPLDDPVAPELTAGATIEPSTGLLPEVGFQVVASLSGTTSDEIAQLESYVIPAGA